MTMTHDDLQSLLGVYALDALEPEEAAVVEAHLAECPRCRAEVADYRNTASYLAAAGGEAPAGVWDRIAAELTPGELGPRDLGARDLGGDLGRGDPGRGEPGPGRQQIPESTNVVPLRRRRRRGALPAVGALAAVAAAAAAFLGVSAAHLDHRVNDLSSAVSTGGLQQAAAAAVLNPDHRAVQLASADHRQNAKVVILPDGNAYLVSSDLPALSSARTYQLWGLTNGKVVSLGLLGSNPQLAAFRVEHGVSRLMVTAEPRGGTPTPTPPVLVQGSVPA